MEEEILRILATAAAGVLVRAMGTRLWTATRDRWAELLGQYDADRRTEITEQLEASAVEVTQAGATPVVVDAVTERWRDTVRTELQKNPELADDARILLDEEIPEPRATSGISQTARVMGGVSIQSGGNTTIG